MNCGLLAATASHDAVPQLMGRPSITLRPPAASISAVGMAARPAVKGLSSPES